VHPGYVDLSTLASYQRATVPASLVSRELRMISFELFHGWGINSIELVIGHGEHC
jgi:hypothetical protein